MSTLPAALSKKTLATPTAGIQSAYKSIELTKAAQEQLEEIPKLAKYLAEQAALASKVTITDDASDARGAELLVNLTKARKAAVEIQGYFTSPLERAKKAIIAIVKKLGEDALGQEERLRQESGAWFIKKQNEARAKEAARLAEQEAAANRATRLGRAAPKPMTAPAPAEQVKTVETEHGNRGMTVYWDWDLLDLAKVPDKYITKTVNKKAVDADIESGVREIPGLLISEKARPNVR